jgi:hypothetical protein
MVRHVLALLLIPVLFALPARAELLRPPGAGFQGFRTLLHPPPPRAAVPPPAPAAGGGGAMWPGNLCRAAIAAAELRHGIPAGLLQAIGLVESGRTDPATGRRLPWPWAVNAEGRGALLESREAAIAHVRQAEVGGMRSIDIGCMQVNRMHHPHAFASLEQGFDPVANADYAARFLRRLREGPAGGDWMKAAGFYHSQTPERAEGYRAKVQAALGGALAAPGGGGQGLGNGAERAAVLAAPPGTAGRGLAAYRARPVPVVGPVALRRGGSAAP